MAFETAFRKVKQDDGKIARCENTDAHAEFTSLTYQGRLLAKALLYAQVLETRSNHIGYCRA